MEANNAKLREALEYLRDASREFCHLILNSKYNEVFDKYKHAEVAKIRDAIANANTALAAPVRNCDVYDGHQAWVEWQHYCADNYPSTDTLGFAAWLLAPAKEAMIE